MKREGWRTVKESRVGLVLLVLLCLGCAFALGVVFGRGSGWEQVVLTSYLVEYRDSSSGAAESAAESDALIWEPSETKPVNINTASQAQLEMLPGIGPALAEAILSYRTDFGPFVTTEQLMEVPGIGEKRYAAVEKLICVEEMP